MKDDLFERLRTVDPATDERVVREARALGDVPGRLASGEPTNVRLFPRAVRRKATLAAVAAVVVVAIALPLTLLRSLGEGGETAGVDSGDWETVGTVADIRSQGIVYIPRLSVFVIAKGDSDPYALSAGTWIGDAPDPSEASRERIGAVARRAIYCEPAHRFLDPLGRVFDEQGRYLTGPVSQGLRQLAVRTIDGDVQVDPLQATMAGTAVEGTFSDGQDPACLTARGVPLEGKPGFAIPIGTELPPIAVGLPQAGAWIQSPIRIVGNANVFEATVSIRVLDANGTVIAESFVAAACGTGCRGDFSAEIEVPIDAEQPGTIQVFESSAQDGSMINTVEIPVTLVPGLATSDPGVEGVWYDGNEVPLPDGSPGVEGTVLFVFRGAEHCGWGSVSFMHVGWPIGTLANDLGEWRQYVRDPEGLFGDGEKLYAAYLSDASLPADAADTGYHRGPWQLWVSPSQAGDAVFIVNGDTSAVERWGRSSKPILCD